MNKMNGDRVSDKLGRDTDSWLLVSWLAEVTLNHQVLNYKTLSNWAGQLA